MAKKVLVVEDDPDYLYRMPKCLSIYGNISEIFFVETLEKAKKLFDEHGDLDVISTDGRYPEVSGGPPKYSSGINFIKYILDRNYSGKIFFIP